MLLLPSPVSSQTVGSRISRSGCAGVRVARVLLGAGWVPWVCGVVVWGGFGCIERLIWLWSFNHGLARVGCHAMPNATAPLLHRIQIFCLFHARSDSAFRYVVILGKLYNQCLLWFTRVGFQVTGRQFGRECGSQFLCRLCGLL